MPPIRPILPPPPRQSGVALAVALILLVVITIMALTAVRLSTLEMRMALNHEIRANAFEQAQSMVDTAISRASNTPVLADNYVICAREVPGVCTDTSIVLDESYEEDLTKERINVLIQRVPPASGPPPVGSGFSADKFASAQMRVDGIFDRNAEGRGSTEIREGVAVVYAAPSEIFTTAGGDSTSEPEPEPEPAPEPEPEPAPEPEPEPAP